MIDFGKNGSDFFTKRVLDNGMRFYEFKPPELYSFEKNTSEGPSKRYFPLMPIPELINSYPLPKKLRTEAQIKRELDNRAAFSDFILGLLNLNPLERWSPHQAMMHPFVTGEPFYGSFQPPTTIIPDTFLPPNAAPAEQDSGSLTFKYRSRIRANTFNATAANTIPVPIQHASGSLAASGAIPPPQLVRAEVGMGVIPETSTLEKAMADLHVSASPPGFPSPQSRPSQSLAKSLSFSSRCPFATTGRLPSESNLRTRRLSYSSFSGKPFNQSFPTTHESHLHLSRSEPLRYHPAHTRDPLSGKEEPGSTATKSKGHPPAYLNPGSGGASKSKKPK